MKWIKQFLIILAAAFIGEVLRCLIPLPIPAGIYGLLLLFLGLCTGLIKLSQVEGAGDFLIEVMPFFFIPAGVGLMTKWTEIKSLLMPIIIAVLLITAAVMAVTGRVSQSLIRRKGTEDSSDQAICREGSEDE